MSDRLTMLVMVGIRTGAHTLRSQVGNNVTMLREYNVCLNWNISKLRLSVNSVLETVLVLYVVSHSLYSISFSLFDLLGCEGRRLSC